MSITDVLSEEVVLEDDEADESTESDDEDAAAAAATATTSEDRNGSDVRASAGQDGAATDKPPEKMSFNEFRRFVNKIVLYLRGKEARGGGTVEEGSASRKDIVKHVLEDIEASGGSEGTFESEEALLRESKRIKLVVSRMVRIERILIELPNQSSDLSKDDRLLAVHPNFEVQ